MSKVGEGLHRSRQRRVGAPYPAARAGIGAASASKPRCRAIKVAEHSHIGRFPIWRQRDPVAAHKAIRDDAHAARRGVEHVHLVRHLRLGAEAGEEAG